MQRCIRLAEKAKGFAAPNPMVGAVIVHNNRIIGEGYHRYYGGGHAEVNAIESVKDKYLLQNSTMYVSLEPCSHYGKTPPCAQLILETHIPCVVIGTLDPFPSVAGRGLAMLNKGGVETRVGILKEECEELNNAFFMTQIYKKPYVYLKWAQSSDGFIDNIRTGPESAAHRFSGNFTSLLVHKLRAEVDAILVGTNTAYLDNPSLTTRLWKGTNPIRVIIDRTLKISHSYKVFDSESRTIVVTDVENQNKVYDSDGIRYVFLRFKNDAEFLKKMLEKLNDFNIQSLLVEGGALLLGSFIKHDLWNESFVETSYHLLKRGVEAPSISGYISSMAEWEDSKNIHYLNKLF